MRKLVFAIVAIVALATLALPLGHVLDAEAAGAHTWAVEGTLSDACQCRVFCPCELAEKPTFGHCKDTAILHVDEGHYGSIDLDGLRVVIVSKSPEGERLVDTVGRLDFAHMYVPEGTTDAQADALAGLARRVFGAWVDDASARISAHETVETAPMEVDLAPHRHRVTIPGVLELDIEALTGHDGEGPVAVHNAPAAGPGMGAILVARSNTYRYRGHGIDWDYGGRSASIRQLDLSGTLQPEHTG